MELYSLMMKVVLCLDPTPCNYIYVVILKGFHVYFSVKVSSWLRLSHEIFSFDSWRLSWWFTSENMDFVTQLKTISMFTDAYSRLIAYTFTQQVQYPPISYWPSLRCQQVYWCATATFWFNCNVMMVLDDHVSEIWHLMSGFVSWIYRWDYFKLNIVFLWFFSSSVSWSLSRLKLMQRRQRVL